MFNYIDYLVSFVEVNQIQRKEYAKRMNSARGKYPEAFVYPQSDLSDQAFQTRNCRVCRQNAKAKETLARLVVYAISSFLHLSVGSMAIELNLPTSGQMKLT